MKLILRFIPMYYKHVKAERKTLLVRFFGVHRVSPLLGRRVSEETARLKLSPSG